MKGENVFDWIEGYWGYHRSLDLADVKILWSLQVLETIAAAQSRDLEPLHDIFFKKGTYMMKSKISLKIGGIYKKSRLSFGYAHLFYFRTELFATNWWPPKPFSLWHWCGSNPCSQVWKIKISTTRLQHFKVMLFHLNFLSNFPYFHNFLNWRESIFENRTTSNILFKM